MRYVPPASANRLCSQRPDPEQCNRTFILLQADGLKEVGVLSLSVLQIHAVEKIGASRLRVERAANKPGPM
jgi:hypothetical protein